MAPRVSEMQMDLGVLTSGGGIDLSPPSLDGSFPDRLWAAEYPPEMESKTLAFEPFSPPSPAQTRQASQLATRVFAAATLSPAHPTPGEWNGWQPGTPVATLHPAGRDYLGHPCLHLCQRPLGL